MRLRARIAACGVASAIVMAGACARPAPVDEVTVFAAASMQTVLNTLLPAWEAETGTRIRLSYAGSSAIARQIENGAPADIFISADEDWMDYVAALDLIDPSSRVPLTTNELVLITSSGSLFGSGAEPLTNDPGRSLLSALSGGRLAVANPVSVPAGKYAQAALENIGAWETLAPHLAPAENVRAALLLVSRGEAPLGIVYRTDAIADPNVSIVQAFPTDTHAPIVYPMALTRRARMRSDGNATRVMRWLLEPEAQTEFARQGFGTGTSDLEPGTSDLGPRTSDLAPVVLLSLKVALIAVVVSAPFAIVMALLLARGNFWGRGLLNALVHLPLVLPPVVTGFALLRTFGQRGMVGGWLADTFGLVFAFRWTGAALAAAVMGFPLMVRAIRLAIENVDRQLEDAASTLGASPTWIMVTVTLPLALPGVLAGMILSFAKALGEFGATIMFVSNIPGETQTLALAIFSLVEQPGADAAVMRLVWISIGVSMSALLVSEWLARRVTSRSAGLGRPA